MRNYFENDGDGDGDDDDDEILPVRGVFFLSLSCSLLYIDDLDLNRSGGG
jgi:hypothetical protein